MVKVLSFLVYIFIQRPVLRSADLIFFPLVHISCLGQVMWSPGVKANQEECPCWTSLGLSGAFAGKVTYAEQSHVTAALSWMVLLLVIKPLEVTRVFSVQCSISKMNLAMDETLFEELAVKMWWVAWVRVASKHGKESDMLEEWCWRWRVWGQCYHGVTLCWRVGSQWLPHCCWWWLWRGHYYLDYQPNLT